MADTERDLTALLALYADNTEEAISPQDLRDGIVSLFGGFADLAVVDNSTSQGSLDNVTPVKLVAFNTNGEFAGATPDHVNDQITVGVAGKYKAELCFSFDGTANTTYIFQPAVNGTPMPAKATRKIGSGNDVGLAACFTILDLAASDVVSVVVSIAESPGAQVVTVRQGALVLTRVR
jgi:hypothetical protein